MRFPSLCFCVSLTCLPTSLPNRIYLSPTRLALSRLTAARALTPRRVILETDAAAIAARVSRPRADTTDIVINEQTVRDACKLSLYTLHGLVISSMGQVLTLVIPVSTFTSRLQQRIGQL